MNSEYSNMHGERIKIYIWGFAYKLHDKHHVSSDVRITCPHTIGLNYNLTPHTAVSQQ